MSLPCSVLGHRPYPRCLRLKRWTAAGGFEPLAISKNVVRHGSIAICAVNSNSRRRRADRSQLKPQVTEPADGVLVADGPTAGITRILDDTTRVATGDNAAATAGGKHGTVEATRQDGRDSVGTLVRSRKPFAHFQDDLGNCVRGPGRTPRRTSSSPPIQEGHVRQPPNERNTSASSNGNSRNAVTWVNNSSRVVASSLRSRDESWSPYPYAQDDDSTGNSSIGGENSIKNANIRKVDNSRNPGKGKDRGSGEGSSGVPHGLQVSRGRRRAHDDTEGRVLRGPSSSPPRSPPPPASPPPAAVAPPAGALRPEEESEVSEGPTSWGPVLALLQRRRQGGRAGGRAVYRTPSQPHAAIAPSPLLAVKMMTSRPARAVAAAVHSLAAKYPVIEAYSTGGTPTDAIAAAASAAAGAVAMAAATDSYDDESAASGAIVGASSRDDGTVAARRGGNPRRGAAAAAAGGSSDGGRRPLKILDAVTSGSAAAGRMDGVLWPLMSEQLLTMAVSGSGSSSSSSARGGGQRSEGNRHETFGDEDPVVLAAVTEVLVEVAGSILTHGVYPVRFGATRLRMSISTATKAAQAASGGCSGGGFGGGNNNGGERSASAAQAAAAAAASALEHMEELLMVPEVICRAVQDGCKYNARHMTGAQVASVLAALGALALTLGPDGRGQLAARALKLLEVGFPEQNQQHPAAAAAALDRPNAPVKDASAAAAPAAAAVSQPLGRQRRLPPPLAALLMLLLVTVLPQELAHRQVRWLMWRQLRALLLPSWRQGHDGAAALYEASLGSDEVESVDGNDQDGGAAAAVGSGGGGKLPLVAVAALLVAGDRLQVLLAASDVEEEALQRLSRRADLLRVQQLLTLLRSLTSKQAMMGSDVLARFVARLLTASASGELHPRDVPPLLGLLADQVYLLERRELSRLAEGIFRAMHRAARRRPDMAGPDADDAAPAAAALAAGSAASGSPIATRDPDLRELAAICGGLELVLGRLKLSWVDPDLLTAVRDELAAFAVSGGAHPEAALKAWQVLLRSPDYRCTAGRSSSTSPDEFIEEARRELLSRAADDSERSSVLEAIMAVQPAGIEPVSEGT
ncbi:hypothetical protein Vafri_6444 [Volvox africanus]|uniref:Uncharacterized protein n=1 Tax=Volvox africanus TaxID=51714 RepID=A0A8J4B2J1_9CHLO|nr:hypothetical protein Vafri_6444 [Volvox africanus]